MDSTAGNARGSSEDLTVKKKSKFKILKSRLFGRIKKKDEGLMKQSQSVSDISVPQGVTTGNDSEDDFVYSRGTLGSRALSHDSIFYANQPETFSEPERVLPQEHIHGKIKALQMKLQQDIRLGPPPVHIPSRRTDDTGASSEDDGLPHSPPEVSLHEGLESSVSHKYPQTHRHSSCLSLVGTGSEEEEQGSTQSLFRCLSPGAKPSLRPGSLLALAPGTAPAADFDSPAHFVQCLDTSAARHRMQVKPKNQRASTKNRRPASSADILQNFNSLEQLMLEREEEEQEVMHEVVPCQVLTSEEVPLAPEDEKPEPDREPSTELSSLADVDMEQPPEQRTDQPRDQLTAEPPEQSIEERPDQPPEQTIEQSREQQSEQPPEQPLEQTIEQPTDQATEQPPEHTIEQPTDQATEQTIEQPTDQATEQPPEQTTEQNSGTVADPIKMSPEPCPAPSPGQIPHPGDNLSPKTYLNWTNRGAVDGAVNESVKAEPTPRTSAPSATPEDWPVHTDAVKRQRPVSGSFRFTISSAWDRPRTTSLTSGIEQTYTSTEDFPTKSPSNAWLQERFTAKLEDVKPKEIPPNPAAGLRAEQSVVLKPPLKLKPAAEPAGTMEVAKAKEALWSAEQRGILKKVGGSAQETGDECVKSGPLLGRTGGGGAGIKGSHENENRNVQDTVEEDSEGRTSFGVKLRSTSLSVRYRSDMARSELAAKRHSAEVSPPASLPQSVAEGGHVVPEGLRSTANKGYQPSRLEDEGSITSDHLHVNPLFLRKPLSLDNPPDLVTLGPPKGKQEAPPDRSAPSRLLPELTPSEPVWMTVAREKTRSLHQFFTSSLTSPPPPQQTPQGQRGGWVSPVERRTVDTKTEPRKPSILPTAAHRAPADSTKEALHSRAHNVEKEERWCKKKEPPASLLSSSPSSAAPQGPVPAPPELLSGPGQPSWLELAKRKSLAWSDKIMD